MTEIVRRTMRTVIVLALVALLAGVAVKCGEPPFHDKWGMVAPARAAVSASADPTDAEALSRIYRCAQWFRGRIVRGELHRISPDPWRGEAFVPNAPAVWVHVDVADYKIRPRSDGVKVKYLEYYCNR